MTQKRTSSSSSSRLSHPQQVRAAGAMLGSAVADALGAPFEFQSGGLYSARFPRHVVGGIGEMIGGGGFNWAPGEFTDDTQMALALANALEEAGGFHPEVMWKHFRTWRSTAKDVGITISHALQSPNYFGAAEAAHEALGGRTASNGSVMRIAPVGVFGVRLSRAEAVELAVEQASLTHHDPSASVGAAFVADIIRGTILTGDFLGSVQSSFDFFAETPWGPYLENE
ncbi:MAG: ADP-ribosylglycohydrolase family protein, partial [Acidimicrobiaceae bacterium]